MRIAAPLAALLLALPVLAQGHPHSEAPNSERPAAGEHGAAPGQHELREHSGHEGGKDSAEREESIADHIFHHVEDEVWLPLGFWAFGRHVDVSITKHVINMWIAAGVLLLVCGFATRKRALIPKGAYSLIELFVEFIRDEVAEKNIGHNGRLYVGYLCSAFFFILFMNLCGLLPIPAINGVFPGVSTATGNLGVTVVLALFTFVVTQIAGMRAQGVVGYWLHLVPSGVPKPLWAIMLPIEIFGLFTKPFALTVRLFANMVAGHIVIFFLISLTLLISIWVWPVAVGFALGIFLLELFVALVQAYVFTMLSALFIGMTQHAH
jgi:F-type H+-transporting ATPase subunit a